jgi:hypothetical protein
MAVVKPFRRTCRQFSDRSYTGGGKSIYLLHRRFAKEPRHYVHAFLLLQKDLLDLFDYIEPADSNLPTYSHRVQQLLMRTCVEIEANLTAILVENGYVKKGDGNLTMHDYKLINRSHRLSSYEARVPLWRGPRRIWRPFAPWDSRDGTLLWYQAYNKSKHDRHDSFHLATFEVLLDAMCGLAIVLSAQFHTETYSPAGNYLSFRRSYSYDANDEMDSAIGDYFRIKFPTDWPEAERYDFNWAELDALDDPFDHFDYSAVSKDLGPHV